MAETKPDAGSIGQDKQFNDAVDAYDAKNGTYQETPPENTPEDSKFATGNMPLQQQQSPFKLGPMGSGGGE
jgi:hypothetical protein